MCGYMTFRWCVYGSSSELGSDIPAEIATLGRMTFSFSEFIV